MNAFITRTLRLTMCCYLAACAESLAATRGSADYSQIAETLDGGGGNSTSSAYANSGSVGGIFGHSAGLNLDVLAGYLAQGENNIAPTFAGYSLSTDYQTPASISFSKLLSKAADVDGDTLVVSSAGPSANGGTLTMLAASLTYAPPAGFSGADTFPITITDARGASRTGTVSVTVRASTTAGGAGINPPVLTFSAGQVGIAFQGIPGRTYLIQRSVNLSTWQTLASLIAGSNGAVSYTDESPPEGSAFYRLAIP